jgi:DNA polymerase III alpha subunit
VDACEQHGLKPILGASLVMGRQRATALVAERDGLHLLIDDPTLMKPQLTDRHKGRVWAEVVRPAVRDDEAALLAAAQTRGIEAVASLAAHFPEAGGHTAYRLATAVRERRTLDQLPARLAALPAHHLAGPEEAAARFADLEESLAPVANAHALAALCRSDVLPRGIALTPAPVPKGMDAQGHLRARCEDALTQASVGDPPGTRRRLEQELGLIGRSGLAALFLLVAEIAAECKRRGWPMALRGSAGGSLVCYLLRITDLDPLRYGLRFERFLHAAREAPPDIDIDLADQCRKPLFLWLIKQHSKDRVARVGSYTHLWGPSSLEAALVAHGLGSQMRALLEEVGEAARGLERGEEVPPPTTWPLSPEDWQRVVASARSLVGMPRELAHHPSGLVLTAGPVSDVAPVQEGPGAVHLLQYDRRSAPRVGLVKLDLLSNHALTVIARGREYLRALDPALAGTATEEFVTLCSRNQVARGIAERASERLRRGRRVTFNKAHALSYAQIGVQEAWLKAHSPLAFWPACLAHHQGRYPKRVHVEEAKRCGVAVHGIAEEVLRIAGRFEGREEVILLRAAQLVGERDRLLEALRWRLAEQPEVEQARAALPPGL